VERARLGRHRYFLAPALTGGSKKTAAFANKHKKPWLHIYRDGQYDAAELLLRFISDHRIKILNVAGPRASKEPQIAAFVKKVLKERFFHDRIPRLAVRAKHSEHASRS
jgi:Circularly permutated YpsA SLOG family